MQETSIQPSLTSELTWQPLVLTREKVAQLWQKAQQFPVIFDDITRGNYEHFLNMLNNKFNLFFEIGSEIGLVCISDVVPSMSGTLYFVMYDRKLKGKERVMMDLIRAAFEKFNLQRLTASIPKDRGAAVDFLRRVGFMREGLLRKAYPRGEKLVGLEILGLLREDVIT